MPTVINRTWSIIREIVLSGFTPDPDWAATNDTVGARTYGTWRATPVAQRNIVRYSALFLDTARTVITPSGSEQITAVRLAIISNPARPETLRTDQSLDLSGTASHDLISSDSETVLRITAINNAPVGAQYLQIVGILV